MFRKPLLPPLSFENLLKLYEGASRDEDESRRKVALEELQRQWERGRIEVAEEQQRFRDSFFYEWREFLFVTNRLVKDAAVFLVAWGLLWAAQVITTNVIPIKGRIAESLHTLHELTVVGVFGVLCLSVLWDILEAKLWRKVRRAVGV